MVNPYYDIELSTATDTEDERVNYERFKEKSKIVKKKQILSAKSKKYKQFNEIDKEIKDFFEKKDFDSLLESFEKFNNLINKNKNFLERHGFPFSYLRSVEFLNREILEKNNLNDQNGKAMTILR